MSLRVRRPFTLIELLVVVAIIGVLASMLLPALSRARERSRITVCSGNQRQVHLTVALYNSDNDDWILPVAWLSSQPWKTSMARPWWQGTLADQKYWSAKVANDLDCPVLPYPSSLAASGRPYWFRAYPQYTYYDGGGQNPQNIGYPRYVRNFYLSRRGAADGYLVSYLKEAQIRNPEKTIHFTDSEPIWAWGAVSCRINYNLTNPASETAKTTHNAEPNVTFFDGRTERRSVYRLTNAPDALVYHW